MSSEAELPMLSVRGRWEDVLHNRHKADLEALLPDYMRSRRWFAGKARFKSKSRCGEIQSFVRAPKAQ